MATICPNCLRPVRADVKYCGYCGTNLVPATVVVSGSAPSGYEEESVGEIKPISGRRQKPKHHKYGRKAMIFPITLLFLVIILALIVRFWPEIMFYIRLSFSTLLLSLH